MLRAATASISSAASSFGRLIRIVKGDRGRLALVVTLLAIDLFWMLYHGVGRMLEDLGLDSSLYNHKELLITTDGGIPEWFNYAQTIVVVVLLLRLARSTRQPIYASLGLTYLLVVLDDAMEIHETFGLYLARWLRIPRLPSLRPQDVGEVLTWAMLAVLVVPLLVLGLVRSSPAHRRNGLAFLLAFGALLFCAIGVDQAYRSFSDAFVGAGVLVDVIEDGGEMLAITAACALALAVEIELKAP